MNDNGLITLYPNLPCSSEKGAKGPDGNATEVRGATQNETLTC